MCDNKIKFIEFKPKHAYQMDWKDKDEFYGIIREQPQYFYSLAASDNALTAVRDGVILGILTTVPLNARSCGFYLNMSNNAVEEFDKDICNLMKSCIKNLTYEYARIVTEAKESNEKLLKLTKYLGFVKEGVMRKYGHNGEDYALYAIARED